MNPIPIDKLATSPNGHSGFRLGLAHLLDMPLQNSSEARLELATGVFWVLISGVFGLSLVSQIGLHLYGLYSLSADESARTLLAYDLTFKKAFEPFIWPPLPKILVGLALKLHEDLFITPRIVVAFVGLLTLAAIVFLTQRLFANRLIALVAGLLAVFIPQRLILSVAPLSDIFAYFFTVLAAAFLIDWLRGGRAATLTGTALCLLLATTVRYEAWFFNVVLAFYLTYRTFVQRDLRISTFVLNSALLAAFPCAWVVITYLHDGSLASFSLTSEQFLASRGHDIGYALKYNAIVTLIRDIAVGPALLVGMLTLLCLIARDRELRVWAFLLFVPLALLGATMALTFGVPLAASFRTDGVWTLLLVPFAAWIIVWLAQRIARATSGRYLAIVLMSYVSIVPFALNSQSIAHEALTRNSVISKDDRMLGARLRELLQGNDRRVLIDAIANLDYMNILVLSNAPDRFTLNVDAEPVRVGLYSTRREYYLQHNAAYIVTTYLTDKFSTAGDLNVAALHTRNISYVLLRNPAFIDALDINPRMMRKETFGAWALFTLRDP